MSDDKAPSGAKPSQKEDFQQLEADTADEDSFPASDPPPNTPARGSRKAEIQQKSKT